MAQTPVTRKLLEFSENDSEKQRVYKLNEVIRQFDQRIRALEIFRASAESNILDLKDIVDG